ncbi:hypothetical protein ACFWPQ_37065 [Streptomyces sp. NPDC058464]|uniref:hypothetical protein n=1 Tax=Streptomyces sp. NPDC058464 TaxID=3346511 RepID=UPI0036663A9D
MTYPRRLFLRLSLRTFVDSVPVMVPPCVFAFVDDGLAWSTLREVSAIPVAMALLSPLWAAWRTRSLVRAARGLGIPVSENALDRTQTHTLTGIPLSLVRTELRAARRASEVGDGNPVGFSWRPFRGKASADGSVTYDEASGETRVELHAGKGLRTDTAVFHGAVFLALCQTVRTIETGSTK